MKALSPGYRRIVLALTCAAVSMSSAQRACAEDKFVYPGAVITAHGKTKARSTLSAASASSTRDRFSVSDLGNGAFHLKDRMVNTLAVSSENPEPYSRKGNICKRASTRRWLATLGGHATCAPNWAVFATTSPNDPLASYQYAISSMNLTTAWSSTTGPTGNSALVLIIDTGVDYNHPDIAANMWTNPREIRGNGIDDDRNGYVDDYYGINAITNSGDPFDDQGHGTHVAGIIGARGNNGVGVTGVNWQAKIIAAKFLSSSGSGSVTDAIKALNYGIALKNAGNNIVVSNNSWGGSPYSIALGSAISAANTAGILFVAAAGNATSNNDTTASYPANYTYQNVISVASVDSANNLSAFSNYGQYSVHLAAPGSSIYSTYPGNRYVYLSGTSMAAPQVSGVALLAQSMCGGALSISQLRTALFNSATYYPSLATKVRTGGVANARGAVNLAAGYCAPSPTATAWPTAVVTSPAQSDPTPQVTATSTATSTPVATFTATATATPTVTRTSTPTATSTPLPTFTPPPTLTPFPTWTPVPTMPATATSTPSPSRTPLPTLTATLTPRPTFTPTRTPTKVPTATPTRMRTPTATPTRTATPRKTPTPTPTPFRRSNRF